jgi:peptidyl-tRNA hydrolase
MYGIARNDLAMSPGKTASQLGHAFLGAFTEAFHKTPSIAAAYAADPPGTKICLQASPEQIYRARMELQQAGIPHFTVIDSGCENFFNGDPILTALGFGPVAANQTPKFIKKLKLL